MKAIIIDDERLARVELRRLLTPHKNIETNVPIIAKTRIVPKFLKKKSFFKL